MQDRGAEFKTKAPSLSWLISPKHKSKTEAKMQSAKNPQQMGETIQQDNEQMKHILLIYSRTQGALRANERKQVKVIERNKTQETKDYQNKIGDLLHPDLRFCHT